MSINENFLKLAESLPTAVRANAIALVTKMGEEIEGIGDEPVVWTPNYLKLVQGTTDRSKLPQGANIGSLVLGEEILSKPSAIIPLRSWNSRQYWDPDHENSRQLCSSPDALLGYTGVNCKTCNLSKFDTDLNKSLCSMVKTFMVITADLKDIFYIQFSKTGYKVGKDWETVMRRAGEAPYRRMYDLTSVTSKEYKNVELLKVESRGGEDSRTPEVMVEFLAALSKQFGEDRKEYLVKFKEGIEEKRATGTLPILEGATGPDVSLTPPSEVPALENNTTENSKNYRL